MSLAAPSQGAMLEQGDTGLSPVPVSGEACDPQHAIASLTIDGNPVPTDGTSCQAFSVVHQSRLGLNVVTGTATDQTGEVATVAWPFLRSPTYFSAEAADPAARATSALLLALGPAFLDDGDRTTPNDLATLAELALAALDVDAAIGPITFAQPDSNGDGQIDTVTHHCVFFTQRNPATGFAAWKNGPATRGAITVDRLALVDGGVSVGVTVLSPSLPFAVTGNVDLGCAGAVQKTVTGDASADALTLSGTAAVALDASGAPSVTFTALTATLQGLALNLDLGAIADLTGLGSAISDALAGEVEGPAQAAIAQALRGALEGRLAEELSALSALQSTITLPPILGGTVLLIESRIDHLEFTKDGALVASSIAVRPATPVAEHVAASPYGAMAQGGALPPVSALGSSSLAAGVSDDALNQLLHAAWLGGAFDSSDLGARLDLGLPGAKLSIDSRLPPVIMPRLDGAPGVDLGWGDIAFDATLPASSGAVEVRGTLSAVVSVDGFDVAAGGQRFGPAFAPGVAVSIQILEADWGEGPATRMAVTDLLTTAAANFLPAILLEAGRAFPLPSLDLRTVDPAWPSLTVSLTDTRMARLDHYELLTGDVTATP
jgi:hypothetical protein